ncbi:hypothetical protein ACHWQZ_G014087 [Mnemiopsis leidyi]
MNGESLLSLLQQKLLAHPDYTQLAHKLKCDVQTHPTRDEQRTILSALSKYDKENKLITTVQQSLLSLGYPNINSAASEALVTLIKKDRGTVFVLHQFLNQPLPPVLRTSLYTTLLSQDAVGARYMDAVRDKPYSAQSPQENVIREKVKGFIQSTPGFSSSHFLHSDQGHQLMIKSLSYWHIHVGRPLADIDYKLIILVISLSWEGGDTTSTVTKVISLLAGLFNLLQSLKATDPTTLNIVLQYVQLAQPDLSEHIMLLRPDLSTSHSTPTAQLVATLHEKLFVGFLSEAVIHFLLDQCVIGSDVSSYNPLFSFTASILCLCSAALSQCNNVSSALSHIEQRGIAITTKQVQHFIQTHYIDSLATQLSTKPARVHFNPKPKTLGEDSRSDSPDNRRLAKEIEDLRKKLAEEKKERNDKHVAHRNEMAILKAENEDLKRRLNAPTNKPKTPDPGPGVLIVPPAARPSLPAPPAPPAPPPESIPPLSPDIPEQPDQDDNGDISGPLTAPLTQKQVQNLWLDIARNVMQRVKRLAFKNPPRKKELDTMTFFLNKQYEEDRAQAEISLFGREMGAEDYDSMAEEEYYDKIFQIDVIVEKLVRERLEGQASDQENNKKKR